MFEALKREGETSGSQSMCWQPNSIFWENQSVQFIKSEHPVFTVLRWSIFLNGCQLYIFHKLNHVSMFFRIMHMFLRQFGWISLKKQRRASNYKKINSNWILEASMMKPSLRWSKWIYGTHNLELIRGSYCILKMIKAAKPEVPVCKTGWSDFHGSNTNLSQDFHRI
jgi:hypothetical protein